MRKLYPHQSHIRWTDGDEKKKAETFAKKNGISISDAGRRLFLRAIREGWEFDFKPKSKKELP